jgi:hypothetical protein
MRKMTLFCIAIAAVLALSFSAQAEEATYPVTGSWQECFVGGGPGQEGNELLASSFEGMPEWEFSGAVLTGEPVLDMAGCYTTVYTGGTLSLTGDPWGDLTATDVTAVNYSCSGLIENCDATHCFTITFSGFFDDAPCVWFKVEATYAGDPSSGMPDCPNPEGDDYVGIADDLTEAKITIITPGDIDDIFCKCDSKAKNHGHFVKCVSHATNGLKKDKKLSGREKGVVQRCAAQQAYSPPCEQD